MGEHHWPEDTDAELLAAVTGIGERREPSPHAVAAAAAMPDDWPDLRGQRDKDPQAPHPWREEPT